MALRDSRKFGPMAAAATPSGSVRQRRTATTFRRNPSSYGFTFIELLVSVAIASILMTLAIAGSKYMRERALLAVLYSDMRVIAQGAARFSFDVGSMPPDVYRGCDPGLHDKYGWKLCDHSSTWDLVDLTHWQGPYIDKWPNNPWGGLYDWDNYPPWYTVYGIPGGGCYLTMKPKTWGGTDGMPSAMFETLLRNLKIDMASDPGVISIWMGKNPDYGVPGQPQ